MRVTSLSLSLPRRPAPVRLVRVARKAFRLSARARFLLHAVASGLSCVLFFGGIVALLWGAA